MGVLAQGIETEEIEFERLNFDKTPSIDIGKTFDFFKEARDLGNKIYELVSRIWGVASSFLESVTGLTLGELFIGLINATIGIIEEIINLLG
ncbi:hypothetical protein AKJ56_02240 [candidate division MSBL1 archaeon SCGC-AAA382N08]|uniref:Uncharacterized protein n=1 Tax=candidate division MSBL1 archaeon SCGC-AAA382N08 TaxID=1698285 RepID=A0A133VN13_9EURY|nr:hypothetical protein AKJ56_02240 [candidate division MSBL1 archaeon SCGC-AAA382N08]